MSTGSKYAIAGESV